MLNLLPKLIHQNQSAFVQGRNIDEPFRFISDFFDCVEETGERYILFAADFQKAFDSVEHPFIFVALRHFSFENDFIRWIRVMLTDINSCVLNNGFASDFFQLNRGTKQGDPISPYLYILIIEILALFIRKNDEIKGVIIKGSTEEVKIALYADDATLCLKNVHGLKECF